MNESKESKLPALQHGYAVRVPQADLIEVVAPGGELCLSIRLDVGGPIVEVRAAALRVASQGDLSLDCDRFEVNARQDIALVSGGGIAQDAHGDVTIRADGEIATEAEGQQHHARRGNVDIRANDDVMLEGERVKLNGPRAFAVPPVDLSSRQPLLSEQSPFAPKQLDTTTADTDHEPE
jgi:uncharacterized protein (DUF2345 family)